jgi:2-oxoisovalerate dehydrogenase E1 component
MSALQAQGPPNRAAADPLGIFERMLLIRAFEQRVSKLYRDGEVPGFVHLSIGQEAIAVGACTSLTDGDVITSTHRGHGHCLAKGMDPEAMFAELMGRDSGTNRGRGGSMHIADPRQGVFGANGIVAAGLPIAVGAATASWLRGTNQVAISFFGDGAVAQGAFHEAANLAALWNLPIIFLCENNGFAEFSATSDQHPVSLEARAAGYGLAFRCVDGNDVLAVEQAVREAVRELRAGHGPMLVEAMTYRWHGHYEGDPQSYRDGDVLVEWQNERDPIVKYRQVLHDSGHSDQDLAEVEAAVAKRIDAAVDAARSAPVPNPDSVDDFVYQDVKTYGPVREPEQAFGEQRSYKAFQAIHDALQGALETDERVFLAGIDVGQGGNVFGLTRGLKERWPSRVLDTPISETAVLGVGVGSAMAGMRPVVEIMYLDFIGVCLDQIMNQAAKMRFMTGGGAEVPLVIRTQFGVGRSSGSQHSQSLEALLAHIPGLKVVMPATVEDTYGLLRASILDPDPVIFIENRLLYGLKGTKPPADHVVPIGRARIAKSGADVTVVAWSQMVHEALAAAEALDAEGMYVEVVDLRTVSPIDYATIHTSIQKTSRLVIASQEVMRHGIGAEIAARMGRDGYWDLDGPIVRLGGPFSPVPYSPVLEERWLPGQQQIADAVRYLAKF